MGERLGHLTATGRRALHLHPRVRAGAAELRALGLRARQVGALAVVTGAVTGLAVAAFDRLAREEAFQRVLAAPLWLQALAPTLGLAIAAACLRWGARGASPSTADEYVREFHDDEHRLDLRPVPGRLAASAASLGSGAALGFEGPSIYIGAAIGSWLQRRTGRLLSRDESKVLLVCGAAAGVAAVFKAPATGLVFALEVPYRQDLARRMLLPAMFAAASSYVVFAAVNGTAPLFPVAGAPPFDLRDLGGAALVGLLCGGAARTFAIAVTAAKSVVARVGAPLRVVGAGAAIACLFGLGHALTGESLTLGSGYGAIEWAMQPGHAVATVLGVFALRALVTLAALGAGGVGGLFIPLVVQGAVLGAAVDAVVDAPDPALFPLLGVAAFLGAGYRVPLAAVVFVAESTGRPAFVVPGLIAAASSQLLMGRRSVCPYQVDERTGTLERRLALPVSAALRTDAPTAPSDATVEELFGHHIGERHMRTVPVVDGSCFVGMVLLDDVARVPPARWSTVTAGELARDWPTADLHDTLGVALVSMQRDDADRVAVLDGDAFVGIVTTGEILKLESILETAEETGLPHRRLG